MPEFGRLPKDYLNEKSRVGNISLSDADILLQYIQETANEVGHSQHTQLSNTRYLSVTIESIPDPKNWTNATINQYVSQVRATGKANTQRKRILLLKQFCEWLTTPRLVSPEVKDKNGKVIKEAVYETFNSSLNFEAIKKIKAPASDKMTKTASQMLSTEQIDKIITAGKNSRDRCLLSVLSESGMRPFEVLRLKWSELKLDEHGVILNTSGKTGNARFIRLVHSSPFVAAWRNDCPFKDDTAFVFTSLKQPSPDTRITHSALKKILRIAEEKAGVKQSSPYILRHSSVTRMLEQGYSDSTIRMIHWGSQTTNMLGTYGHVSAMAVDAEILGRSGLTDLKKRERKPVNQCPTCSMIVKPTDQWCPKCGTGLTDAARIQIDREKDQLTKDILAKVKEMMNSGG